MNAESRELLLRGAVELGLEVSAHLDTFAHLLDLLQEGNTRLNLTALRTEPDIVLKHFVDSLSCLRGGLLDGEGWTASCRFSTWERARAFQPCRWRLSGPNYM